MKGSLREARKKRKDDGVIRECLFVRSLESVETTEVRWTCRSSLAEFTPRQSAKYKESAKANIEIASGIFELDYCPCLTMGWALSATCADKSATDREEHITRGVILNAHWYDHFLGSPVHAITPSNTLQESQS
jgi:hypothetical protein